MDKMPKGNGSTNGVVFNLFGGDNSPKQIDKPSIVWDEGESVYGLSVHQEYNLNSQVSYSEHNWFGIVRILWSSDFLDSSRSRTRREVRSWCRSSWTHREGIRKKYLVDGWMNSYIDSTMTAYTAGLSDIIGPGKWTEVESDMSVGCWPESQ